jgi:alkylated DNA repair dioxygenase AlkB
MHREVISEEFEDELIAFVQTQCERGRNGELKKPTYLRASGARSQGNQREAIMYGGFFDFNRARPGKRGLVPPFPPILERLVDHLVKNNYLPNEVRPDSCIINRYDRGDCIPPHVDHSSYYRPISTLSLLGEEPMLVGSRFRTVRSCTWAPTRGKSIPLGRRSLLVLGGNSANIAKHCISSCSGPRISITLRKQPPPEWKPDTSELVGKGGQPSKQGDDESRVSGEVNNGSGAKPKKKTLSGSAKRKKKMMVAQVGRPAQVSAVKQVSSNKTMNKIHGKKNCSDDRISNHKSAEKGSGKLQGSNGKLSEKQARRNARRLEKKKQRLMH